MNLLGHREQSLEPPSFGSYRQNPVQSTYADTKHCSKPTSHVDRTVFCRVYGRESLVFRFRVWVLGVVLGFSVVSLMSAGVASAVPVVLNEVKNQSATGQDFTFLFSEIPASDGTDGTLILHARGDYGDVNSYAQYREGLFWNLEGVVSGGPIGRCWASGGFCEGRPFDSFSVHFPGRDYEFIVSYTISGSVMTSVTADFMTTISVNLDSSVDFYADSPRFVGIELRYSAVPEPSTALLLGIGLTALSIKRRRTS